MNKMGTEDRAGMGERKGPGAVDGWIAQHAEGCTKTAQLSYMGELRHLARHGYGA
jgi:hypothetical protein